MVSHPWHQRILRWTRDLVLLICLISLVEWWQARDLPKEQMPISLHSLPLLEPKPLSFDKANAYKLIYVFAPWCGVCRFSADNLNRLQMLDIEVQTLALSWDDQWEVKRFVEDSGLRVPVYLGNAALESQLHISAYPTQFLVNPDGKIVKAWQGYTSTVGFYWKILWNRLWD